MTIVPSPIVPLQQLLTAPRRRPAPSPHAWPFERFRAAYPDYIEALTTDRRYRDRQMELLALLPPPRRRDRVRKLLRDRRLHHVYAFDAFRRLNQLGSTTPDTIRELATHFNAFAPVYNEPVSMRLADKGSGRRWVHDFGPRRRMQQGLVAAILLKLHPPLRMQKLFNGGMPKAFEAVEAAYQAGMTHGVEVDFVNFYGSIIPDRLAELLRPLPATCVEHVVWDVVLHDIPYGVVGNDGCPPPSALAGLSLGASTSPIVGERIVRELLAVARLPDTITYADNLFVIGRSATEVGERIEAIQVSARELEAGSLGLRTDFSHQCRLEQPFAFLKRDGVAVDDDRGRRIIWRPGPAKLDQYRITATEEPIRVETIDVLADRIRHWRRSYPNWPDGDLHEAAFLASLATRRYYTDSNSANLTAATHAVVIAYIAFGQREPADMFIPTEGDPSGNKRLRLVREVQRWIAGATDRLDVADDASV